MPCDLVDSQCCSFADVFFELQNYQILGQKLCRVEEVRQGQRFYSCNGTGLPYGCTTGTFCESTPDRELACDAPTEVDITDMWASIAECYIIKQYTLEVYDEAGVLIPHQVITSKPQAGSLQAVALPQRIRFTIPCDGIAPGCCRNLQIYFFSVDEAPIKPGGCNIELFSVWDYCVCNTTPPPATCVSECSGTIETADCNQPWLLDVSQLTAVTECTEPSGYTMTIKMDDGSPVNYQVVAWQPASPGSTLQVPRLIELIAPCEGINLGCCEQLIIHYEAFNIGLCLFTQKRTYCVCNTLLAENGARSPNSYDTPDATRVCLKNISINT